MSQSAADANAITTQPLLSPMNIANAENKANTPVYPDEAASAVITTQPLMNDPTDEEQEKKKQQNEQTAVLDEETIEAAGDCCFVIADCSRSCECPSCDNCCDGDTCDCCTGCCDNGQSADINVDGSDCVDFLECCSSCFECCSSD